MERVLFALSHLPPNMHSIATGLEGNSSVRKEWPVLQETSNFTAYASDVATFFTVLIEKFGEGQSANNHIIALLKILNHEVFKKCTVHIFYLCWKRLSHNSIHKA